MRCTRHQQAVDRTEAMLYQSTLCQGIISLDSTGTARECLCQQASDTACSLWQGGFQYFA